LKSLPPLCPRARRNLIYKFQPLYILKHTRKNAARPFSLSLVRIVINLDSRVLSNSGALLCMCAPRSNCCSLRNAVAEHSLHHQNRPHKTNSGAMHVPANISAANIRLSGSIVGVIESSLSAHRSSAPLCARFASAPHNEICTAEKQHNEISSMRERRERPGHSSSARICARPADETKINSCGSGRRKQKTCEAFVKRNYCEGCSGADSSPCSGHGHWQR
jgi:hypothetical protein